MGARGNRAVGEWWQRQLGRNAVRECMVIRVAGYRLRGVWMGIHSLTSNVVWGLRYACRALEPRPTPMKYQVNLAGRPVPMLGNDEVYLL